MGYLQILRKIPLILLARPLARAETLFETRQQVTDFVVNRLSRHYHFDRHRRVYQHPYLQPVYDAMNLPPLDISSTQVRQQSARGQSINAMVPETVADYIRSKGLYQ